MLKKDGSMDEKRGIARFESGGDRGPVGDRREYENRINELPADERLLTQELSRFADLCQYFEREKIDVPAAIVDELGGASRLPVHERVEAMKKLNQRLMESLPNVGDDPGIRQ